MHSFREKKKLLNVLKVIGMLLILNSHSDELFPDRIRFLATGGALGNGLFFIISGYLTNFKGIRLQCKILLRYIKLYTPVYLVILFDYFTRKNYLRGVYNLKTMIQLLFWPTPYWFVSAAFVFFILLILLEQIDITRGNRFLVFSIVLTIMYCASYVFGIEDKSFWVVEDGKIFGWDIHFKCIYNFYVFCLGYYLRQTNKALSGSMSLMVCVISFGLVNVFKFLLQKGYVPMSLQFVSQILVIMFCISSLMWAIDYEHCCSTVIDVRKYEIIEHISRLSLEAYIIQILTIPIVAQHLTVFPINYIVSGLIVLVGAMILYYLDMAIYKKAEEVL